MTPNAPTESSTPRKRLFRAYNVGLPKTGTTSIAGIFGNYACGHEYMFPETTRAIGDYATGAITREELKSFLLHRDRLGGLEMDSASFSFSYVDLLIDEFPEAKFVFTIRDCYSWLDSVFNLTLLIGTEMPQWMIEYGKRTLDITIPREMLQSREQFVAHVPGVLDGFLRYWAERNSFVLRHLPLERSLLLRTSEISSSIDRLAAFIGVPASSLMAENSHLFIDRESLNRRFDAHCSELMKKLFPDHTLRDFLGAA
jgi:hypothetical protein